MPTYPISTPAGTIDVEAADPRAALSGAMRFHEANARAAGWKGSSYFDDARAAGFTNADMVDHLAQHAQSPSFDIHGARAAGYSPDEIIQHLEGPQPTTAPNGFASTMRGAGNVALGGVASALESAPNALRGAGRTLEGYTGEGTLQPAGISAAVARMTPGNLWAKLLMGSAAYLIQRNAALKR